MPIETSRTEDEIINWLIVKAIDADDERDRALLCSVVASLQRGEHLEPSASHRSSGYDLMLRQLTNPSPSDSGIR